MRKAVGAIFAATLVVAAAACNEDPLAEDRDKAEFFQLNPTVVSINAGSTARVAAVIVNKYGGSTFSSVTAEPCDSKITAAKDTTRTGYQPPERFVVTAGNTLGASCLIVKADGVTDTIQVRVVPASMRIVGDSVLSSGEPATFTVQFFNAAGAAATGFTNADVDFSATPTAAGTFSGNTFSAQAPNVTTITASLKSGRGAIRTATKVVTVVAGNFAGTFTPTNPFEGSVMTINAGALEFDTDTQVLVNGVAWPWVLARTATAITLVTPPTGVVVISNIGAAQVALNATIPVRSHEPLDDDVTTTRVLAENDSMWFSVGDSDDLDLAKLVVPAGGGTYRFTLDWNPNSPARDLDVIFFNADGDFMGYGAPWGGCGTSARPEVCTVPLPAGTWYPAVNLYSGDPTTAKLLVVKQ